VLVPRKEGATVAATPTFSQYSGQLRCLPVGPVGQYTEKSKPSGNTHKIPQMSQTRYETPAIFRHQMKLTNTFFLTNDFFIKTDDTNTCKEAVVKAEAKTVAY
jgi:hypothetical protein